MRAVTSDIGHATPTDSFARVLDQFASLSDYSSDATTVGGYRVLSSRRTTAGKTRRYPSTATAATARSGGRLRWTGSLSVLFIGGLGLAVLAGPASCPCSSAFTLAEQSSLARLGYVQNAHMMTERETLQPQSELPVLSTAALIAPEESAIGESPITTSALEPARDAATAARDEMPATSAGRLPAKIEEVADAGPENVQIAAASDVTTDVPPTLPTIEVATPPSDDLAATEPEREPTTKARRSKKRTALRAYRAGNDVKSRAKAKTLVGDPTKQAPRWAQQMFVNPWQSRAFSYTQ
jgi:hypothetical protein